ncbi:MAG: hypothetical protein K5765_09445, partial [Clostridia bacterium]|nr:hypothetical protein [Clostridia bacterium]
METNRYRIISVDSSRIYKDEQEYGKEIGLKLPDKKDDKYYDYFNNVFEDSLELRQLEKIYIKYRRKKFYFDDEYNNKYTTAIINVKFEYITKTKGLKELRDYFYNNGFNCNGVHYVRYKRSSGSSREGKCLFVDEKLYKPMTKWGECGIKEPSDSFASWESYKALSLSSIIGTIKIPLNGILFIKDYKSIFNDDVIEVMFNKDSEKIESRKNNIEISNNIWDGESLLDESLFTGEYENKHMLLLRNKFFKSCAFKTKLQKWFKDKKIDIEQLKKLGFVTSASDISQIVMVTTESSMKFLKFMKNGFIYKNIEKWLNNVDEEFGIVKHDEPTKFFSGRMVQCSYQFINTLGLSKEDVNQLLKPSNDFLDLIRKDYDFMLFYLSEQYKKRGKNKNDNSDDLNDRSEVIRKLLHINYDFKDTMLYNNFVNDIVEVYKNELKQGHILLHGTNATLFGNGPEMLYALSGDFKLNENNDSISLKPGEIFCSFFKNGEEVVCQRSPHITMGNLYCVKNNLNECIWEYFDLGNNVVCVNAIKENIQQRLNGCDYDSDTMLITSDKLLVNVSNRYKDKFGVPTCAIEPMKKQIKFSISEVDYKISENKIGEIVNTSQILNSILWDNINNNSNKNIDDIYNNICALAVLSGIEIDKA